MKWQLFKIGIKQSFIERLLGLISLIASVVTISVAYFHDRKFNPTIFWDWLVILFCLLAFGVFFYRCYKILWKWEKLILPRKVFFEYVAYQAAKADNTIKSIAGDLSWLKEQKDTYISLAKKTNLHIIIYYSAERVLNDEETKSTIEEYKQNNIQMIPYPSEIQLGHVKGMLIDINDENSRFLSFTKVNEGESFIFTKYYYDTNEYYLATAFLDSIEKYLKLKAEYEDINNRINRINKKVFIGVSGINNIGKSTLCRMLKQKYSNDLAIIQDPFIGEAKQSTFEVSLFCMLNQLLDYRRIIIEQSNKSVFLFDRTPIDNLAFLIHYKTTNVYDRYIEHLKNEIKIFMASFDAIVLLYPEKTQRWNDTSFLEGKVRSKLPQKINSLYREIYSDKVITYRIKQYRKESDFKLRIKEIVDHFSQKLDNLSCKS